MFKNLAGKLRVIGWITFIACIIATVLIAIPLCNVETCFYGLGILIGGLLGSWLSALVPFTIAEILENTEILKEKSAYGRYSDSSTIAFAGRNVKTTVNKTENQNAKQPENQLLPEIEEGKLNAEGYEFIRGALDFIHADGTLSYAKKHFNELSVEAKESLAAIAPLIENNNAVGLRTVLMSIKK